jgi:hypothetical protein
MLIVCMPLTTPSSVCDSCRACGGWPGPISCCCLVFARRTSPTFRGARIPSPNVSPRQLFLRNRFLRAVRCGRTAIHGKGALFVAYSRGEDGPHFPDFLNLPFRQVNSPRTPSTQTATHLSSCRSFAWNLTSTASRANPSPFR